MLTESQLAQVNASVQAVVDAARAFAGTVEGLVKPEPWVPRFKVGDRVKLSHRDTDAFGKVSGVLHKERSYRLTNSGFSWLEQDLEPAPPLPDPERERFEKAYPAMASMNPVAMGQGASAALAKDLAWAAWQERAKERS